MSSEADDSWMDEAPGEFPWSPGDLMEIQHGPHAYYWRTLEVDASGVSIKDELLGGVSFAFDPTVAQ